MTNLKPYGERVIVKLIEKETTTKSGIILSESSKDKTNKAIVVASNCEDVKVNETVILANHAGNKAKDGDGNSLLIVKLCDIIAVVDGE